MGVGARQGREVATRAHIEVTVIVISTDKREFDVKAKTSWMARKKLCSKMRNLEKYRDLDDEEEETVADEETEERRGG